MYEYCHKTVTFVDASRKIKFGDYSKEDTINKITKYF